MALPTLCNRKTEVINIRVARAWSRVKVWKDRSENRNKREARFTSPCFVCHVTSLKQPMYPYFTSKP